MLLVQVQAMHFDSSLKIDLFYLDWGQMAQLILQFVPDKEFDILHSLEQSPTC